jgi:signal recognition particle GTPase
MRSAFTLRDFIAQIAQVKNLGPMARIMRWIPGMRQTMERLRINNAKVRRHLTRMRAIYDSMTPGERDDPGIIGPGRRRRIARGAGLEVIEVSRSLKEFGLSRELMRVVGNAGIFGRVRAVSEPGSVLGLVTGNRRVRDPSYSHWPDPNWRRLWVPIGVSALAAVVALACARVLGLL